MAGALGDFAGGGGDMDGEWLERRAMRVPGRPPSAPAIGVPNASARLPLLLPPADGASDLVWVPTVVELHSAEARTFSAS
mmetsp:Transcript_18276/g.47133  ORF Transcript_18276/g.47133 Transcript_18276/m.47133 type:complete len:80 (-) Transcript_18276:322-561(-)